MNLFSNTRAKRNTAFVVLLVWLFALASGVANACLLESPELHSKAPNGPSSMTIHAPAELAGHAGTHAGHDDGSDNTRKSCLKVCDDGTHTLPSANSGVDHTDPGPALLVATLWAGSPHVISVSRRMHDSAIPVVGPPLRVRYSRLAL